MEVTGEGDTVVVKKLDRLGRSPLDLVYNVTDLGACGVDFYVLS